MPYTALSGLEMLYIFGPRRTTGAKNWPSLAYLRCNAMLSRCAWPFHILRKNQNRVNRARNGPGTSFNGVVAARKRGLSRPRMARATSPYMANILLLLSPVIVLTTRYFAWSNEYNLSYTITRINAVRLWTCILLPINDGSSFKRDPHESCNTCFSQLRCMSLNLAGCSVARLISISDLILFGGRGNGRSYRGVRMSTSIRTRFSGTIHPTHLFARPCGFRPFYEKYTLGTGHVNIDVLRSSITHSVLPCCTSVPCREDPAGIRDSRARALHIAIEEWLHCGPAAVRDLAL